MFKDILDEEIGFSKLIWLLSKSGKLIVGHNMLTDVMQILRQFFCSTLPEKFDDFKSMTNSLFPRFYIFIFFYMLCFMLKFHFHIKNA